MFRREHLGHTLPQFLAAQQLDRIIGHGPFQLQIAEEELEREKNRLEATKLELKRKLVDLHERSRILVTAQLHSALIVWLQTVHINCQLIRKKQKREVVAVWNPYHKQVEPLRCSKSNNSVTNFYLTDESAQIICPTVWSS